jgi:hypothetical protein
MAPTLTDGVNGFTVCVTVPLAVEWLLSPLNVAVTTSLGPGNTAVVQAAVDPLAVPLSDTFVHSTVPEP